MGLGVVDEIGLLLTADGDAVGASWMKVASAWGIDGAWNVADEDLTVGFYCWIGRRDGAEEGFCVGVRGVVENVVYGADFDDASEVHDGDTISYEVHYC